MCARNTDRGSEQREKEERQTQSESNGVGGGGVVCGGEVGFYQ